MSNPQPIYAVTQFSGATGADWRGVTQPIPAGVLTIEEDTGIVKRGNGITLYVDLPVFFNAKYLQDASLTAQQSLAFSQAAALSATAAAASARLAQLGSTIATETLGTTPAAFRGMGIIADGVACQRLVGQVLAQNPVSGDIITWDVAAIGIRRGAGVPIAFSVAPTITLNHVDSSMSACSLAFSIGTTGIILTATGLNATPLLWTGKLVVSSIGS